MRELANLETVFSDYTRACDERCFACERCQAALVVINKLLARPNAITWEVWRDGDELPCGVVSLAELVPGHVAEIHYAFFDGRLRDKTEFMRAGLDWIFAEREGWRPPRRIMTAFPDYAFALARHAHKHLGFGGDFTYNRRGYALPVEGVARKSIRWRDSDRDVLLMAILREGDDDGT